MHATKKTIVLNLLVSVYQPSVVALFQTHTHTLTSTHTCKAGKTNTLLICPPRGFVGSLRNLRLARQESTWKRNKGPAPRFALSFSKVCRYETHTALLHSTRLHAEMHTHTHSEEAQHACFATDFFSSSQSSIDLILESDGEVRESGCKQ